MRTTCVSIVSIAAWAVEAAAVAVTADDDASTAEAEASVAVAIACSAEDDASNAVVSARAALAEAALAEAAAPAPKSTSDVEPAAIVISPATWTAPLDWLKRMKLPEALPAKKLPAPSTKKPVPLDISVGGVAPRAILPVPSVERSNVDVSIFRSLVTNSNDVPENVSLFPLALPTLKSPLLLIKIPVPAVLVAVEAFDVSKAKLCVVINNLEPPFKVKFSDTIFISPAPSWRIKLFASPTLNWLSVYQ